jgi:hypothetical protein
MQATRAALPACLLPTGRLSAVSAYSLRSLRHEGNFTQRWLRYAERRRVMLFSPR